MRRDIQPPTESDTAGNTRVQESDRHNYTCKASNALGTTEKTFHLQVLGKMQLTMSPTNTTAVVGKNATLQCRYTGKPAPNITWYKVAANGSHVDSNRVQSTGGDNYRINNVTRSDAGVYVCTGYTAAEKMSAYATLTVEGPPIVRSKNSTITKGSDALLHCDVLSIPPVTNYVWSVPYGNDTGTITVTVYVPISITITPGLVSIAQNAPSSDPVSCTATDSRPAQWWKDGKQISTGGHLMVIPGGVLLLQDATLNDTGEYVCALTGNHSVSSSLFVYLDRGRLSCNTTLDSCGAALCGANCTSRCRGSNVYGTQIYEGKSSVCGAAMHGDLSPGQTVLWKQTTSIVAYVGTARHGITSSNASFVPGSTSWELFSVHDDVQT
ncbi:hypothetical protein ScPMuIL_002603 [Solemya velum]